MSAMDRARRGWGETPPDWIVALARACERETQARVARRLGYSDAVVSNVLKGNYRGDLAAVETAVRAQLQADRVTCPVLGEIALARCLEEQARPLRPTSGLRVRLYHACRTCPNNRTDGADGGAG